MTQSLLKYYFVYKENQNSQFRFIPILRRRGIFSFFRPEPGTFTFHILVFGDHKQNF
jgi:hypothetical protein